MMMRTWFLSMALLVAACSDAGEAPRQRTKEATPNPHSLSEPPSPNSATALKEEPRAVVGSLSAAELLRRYYAHVEAGDYGSAFRLREAAAKGPTLEQFAASFAPYREQRATIGTPSETVLSAGWLYVEVPVHIYGTLKSGAPFSSAGTVTLRRRAASSDENWRIYPGR